MLAADFSFGQFLAISCRFKNLKLSSLNFALNFRENNQNFCPLDVLVCCCAANQYSEFVCVFFKYFKKQCTLQGLTRYIVTLQWFIPINMISKPLGDFVYEIFDSWNLVGSLLTGRYFWKLSHFKNKIIPNPTPGKLKLKFSKIRKANHN